MKMVTDKNGKELKVGDEITVRGRIMETPMDLEGDGKGVLRVKWDSEDVPLLDYVISKSVQKAE